MLSVDRALGAVAASWAGHPALDALAAAISLVSIGSIAWVVLGALLAVRGGAPLVEGFVRLLWSLLLAALLANVIIKPIVFRARPSGAATQLTPFAAQVASLATGASFPSGHATQAAAGAYALSLMWARRRALLVALATCVMLSRLHLGVHYPLDVVVGAVLGLLVARFATGGTACYLLNSASRAPLVPR